MFNQKGVIVICLPPWTYKICMDMYRLYTYGGEDHTNAGEDHTNGRRAEGMKAFRALDASLELGKLI